MASSSEIDPGSALMLACPACQARSHASPAACALWRPCCKSGPNFPAPFCVSQGYDRYGEQAYGRSAVQAAWA